MCMLSWPTSKDADWWRVNRETGQPLQVLLSPDRKVKESAIFGVAQVSTGESADRLRAKALDPFNRADTNANDNAFAAAA